MWGEPGHDDKFAARAGLKIGVRCLDHIPTLCGTSIANNTNNGQRDNRGRLLHVRPLFCPLKNAHFELQKTSRTTPNLTR